MKIRSGFPVTQVLTRFSKNREDKRKSLLSKQELSAFNAKKKKEKKRKRNQKKKKNWNLKANTVDFAHGPDKLRTRHRAAKSQEPTGTWVCPHLPLAEARSLHYCWGRWGVSFGVYIQTHPRLMFYVFIYVHAWRPTTLSLWKLIFLPQEAGCQV